MIGALVGSLLCFLEPVGLALDGEDFGVMDETIDEGDHASGIGKDLAPFCEWAVGGHDGALVLVTSTDELEQQVGMAIGIGEVSDLVDDEQARVGVAAQSPADGSESRLRNNRL